MSLAKACEAQAHWFNLNTQTETFESGNSSNPLALKLQYSRDEAAMLLGISERTLDRLIAEKELLVRRIGRRVLVPKDALQSFMRRDHKMNVVY
jgi:excisionase family DNA binding protein